MLPHFLRKQNKQLHYSLFVGLLVCVALALLLYSYRSFPHTTTVSFLSVGQGDSMFVTTPNGTQVLIDGGRSKRVLRALSSAMPFYDRSIDMVIGTHIDSDHIGGLPAVYERFAVTRSGSSGLHRGQATVVDVYRRAFLTEGTWYPLRAGDRIWLDRGNDVFIDVLWPPVNTTRTDVNDTSLVMRLSSQTLSVLFTSDISQAVEQSLVERHGDMLASTVLKLGHHGSQFSTSPLLLETVSPAMAIVSAGCDNPYGHPDPLIVRRVQQKNITLLETCDAGTITLPHAIRD